ncbi:hypothetical protein [Xanthomonas phaseoli]|uniref:hypothetical protein n=1 Tax=Xanthomonas phaseoli TaxID=1985254 RepID=UPI00126710DB|nr:hypothetical protein [Xanthomonas phaseoli]
MPPPQVQQTAYTIAPPSSGAFFRPAPGALAAKFRALVQLNALHGKNIIIITEAGELRAELDHAHHEAATAASGQAEALRAN